MAKRTQKRPGEVTWSGTRSQKSRAAQPAGNRATAHSGRRRLPWLSTAIIVIVAVLGAVAARSLLVQHVQVSPRAIAATTPLPTPQIDSREHRWLAQPLDRTAPRDFPDRTYLFGTSKNNAYRIHHGVDIVDPTGTPVHAAADGVVAYAGKEAGTRFGPSTIPNFYGNLVLVKLPQQFRGQNVYYLYGHFDQVLVKEGQQVKQGDIVGKIGMTGTADGPHVHVEVRVGDVKYGNSRNPALWLQPLPGTGALVGKVIDRAGAPVDGASVTILKDIAASDVQKYWSDLTTYVNDPLGQVNIDEAWGENFAVVDLPAGQYEIRVNIGGQTYVRKVTVVDGLSSWLEVQEGTSFE